VSNINGKKLFNFLNTKINSLNKYLKDDNYKPIKYNFKKDSDVGVVYLLESNGLYKIGMTKNFETRFSSLKTGNIDIKKYFVSPLRPDYKEKEMFYHRKFKNKNVKLEWFRLNENNLNFIINDLKNMDKFIKK